MVNVGDKVVVDGKQAVVTSRTAAGKHVSFTLSDGRVRNDLHLRKDVEVVSKVPAVEPVQRRSGKVKVKLTPKEVEPLPVEDNDLEE